jgi:hypothetical protein
VQQHRSYGVDTARYADSAATDHVTRELDKLAMREKYHGQDQIHIADGLGIHITHVDNSIIPTPTHDIRLNNVLHVPSTSKNLVFIHRLTYDNNVLPKVLSSVGWCSRVATRGPRFDPPVG